MLASKSVISVGFICSFSCLLILLLLPSQNIRQDLGCLFIWGLLCLEVSWQFQPSDPRSARQKEKDSAFEMRHLGSSPLMYGRVRCEQAMCYTLSDPHLGLPLVLKVLW